MSETCCQKSNLIQRWISCRPKLEPTLLKLPLLSFCHGFSVFFFVSFLLFVYLFQRVLIPATLFICFLLWWSLFHMGRDIPATSIFASAKVSVTNNPKHILGTLIAGDWCSSELFGYRWRYKNKGNILKWIIL
jgi:hypothetical protein